jgi:lipoprotein-anchoring transpeptidase ErfK/SrfK
MKMPDKLRFAAHFFFTICFLFVLSTSARAHHHAHHNPSADQDNSVAGSDATSSGSSAYTSNAVTSLNTNYSTSSSSGGGPLVHDSSYYYAKTGTTDQPVNTDRSANTRHSADTGNTASTARSSSSSRSATNEGFSYHDSEGYEWNSTCNVDCMLISLAEQRLYVFGNHELIAWSTISSGRPGHTTPTGMFTITEKDLDHHSNLYNNAPMPFFMRLTDGGVGMHAGVLPGYPASHGCIRLPEEMARRLYQHVEPGTTVQIIEDTTAKYLAPDEKATPTVARG